MNVRMILKTLGYLLMVESACMLPSMVVSIIHKQSDTMSFLITIIILAVLGLLMSRIPIKTRIFIPGTALQ